MVKGKKAGQAIFIFLLLSQSQTERFNFLQIPSLVCMLCFCGLPILKNWNPLGLPISPHNRRQMSSRIGDYSGKTSSLVLRQARQSLNLGQYNSSLWDNPNVFPNYLKGHPLVSFAGCRRGRKVVGGVNRKRGQLIIL